MKLRAAALIALSLILAGAARARRATKSIRTRDS